ncbi:MAG: PLP-dependent cysteine synthase family protein [Deltaproteobacteria bacterium]
MNIYDGILKLIGATPLIRLANLAPDSQIHAKLEYLNPGGSLKDRVALYIVQDAERRGELTSGGLIVEATSGNMGIGFALVGAARGYRCVFALPESVSAEKIQILRQFGAEVILTPGGLLPSDERSCYRVAQRIASERGGFYVNQYYNPLNPEAHYRTTAPEIWRDTAGRVDVVVCGMGTGGTATGVGKYLKERVPQIKIIGVEPRGSAYRGYLKTGAVPSASGASVEALGNFDIEGIGKNFIPGVVDFAYIDDVIQVSSEEARACLDELVRREGIFVGPSGGAVMAAALQYAKPSARKGDVIIALLPDSGMRYLSKL